MKTDFPTASAGTSQAPSAAVEKSDSASHTEIRTLPFAMVCLRGKLWDSEDTRNGNCK